MKSSKRHKTSAAQITGHLLRKIDFYAKTTQRITFEINGMEVDCLVKPLKQSEPAPHQLKLF